MSIKTSDGTIPRLPDPEPVEYEVVGATRVFGVAPGGKLARIIPPAQEARLLASGALRRVEAAFTREGCEFGVCPDPDACKVECQAPADDDESDESDADGVGE